MLLGVLLTTVMLYPEWRPPSEGKDKVAQLWVVGQFAVAALYERRNLLNQKPAVMDRPYKKPK
jgi:hypothetical protein